LRLLKQVLQQAVDDGLLDRNAATAVRSFPVGRTRGPRGTSLSPREFARYVDVTHAMIEDGTLKPDVGRMVLVLAWTGLRIGEVRALRFVDWDEDEQELHIDRAGWRNHVKGTKIGEPRRAAVVEPLRLSTHGGEPRVRRAHAGWRSERVQALYATVDPDERRAAGAAVVALVAAVKQGTPPGQPAPETPPPPPQAPTSPSTTAGTPGTPDNAGAPVAAAASFVDEQGLPPRGPAPSPVAAGVAPAAPTAASDAARVVRPLRPEPLSGTPEGTPGVPDESMWN
jgi:hypothetical protein